VSNEESKILSISNYEYDRDKVRAYSIGVLVVIFLDNLVVISNNVKGFLGSGITFLANIVLK